MKIPSTEQLLIDTYNALEDLGSNVLYFFLHPPRTMGDILPDTDNSWVCRELKKLSRKQFNRLLYKLKKGNYITVKTLHNKYVLSLTKEGIDRAVKAKFKNEKNMHPKRKDGKWIMVIFDVPQKRESKRFLLRNVLKNLGYKVFQKSVWVTPYDVSEKTEEQFKFYNLTHYTRMFLIEEII